MSPNTLVHTCGDEIARPKTLAVSVGVSETIPSPKTPGEQLVENTSSRRPALDFVQDKKNVIQIPHENPTQVKEGVLAPALKEILKLVNGVIKVQELSSTILYGPHVSSPTFECHWAQVKEA